MPDKVEYIFNSRGGYWGDVTGKHYHYSDGERIVAPKGEFAGENSAFYETRPVRPSSAGAEAGEEPEEEYTLGEHKTSGYYYVRKGGERALKDDGEPLLVGQGKEAAQQRISELNSEVQ